ncbi:MMPL family transporter [Oceaniserpentilla sp. 4NH20-0058]|uniref:efflux RND transporter permease subunit n=1 Tax=Oceaniserpentilla sp. 4NH20-0058 TaxID=3127660 RepID=UPI003107F339
MLKQYSDLILNNRWKVLLVWLLLLISFGIGLGKITFSSDYRVFFGEDNPELLAFTKMQDTFSSSDNVLIAVTPKDGSSVFTAASLQAIQDITQRSWKAPYSTRVDSLTNYQYSYAEQDDLIVADLVSEENLSESAIALAKTRALAEKQLVNRLVSNEGHVGAINITIRLPGKFREAEVPEVGAFVKEMMQDVRATYPDLDFHVSGQIMMNNTLVEASQFDMGVLFPITLLIIILGTGLFVRGVSATLGVFLVIIMSIISAIGITGWMGIQLSPPSASAPTIILTLVVADCMHILSTYFYNLRKGLSSIAAMHESIVINFKAIFITTVTTIMGFLTLNFSDSPPFRDLGNITALGVFAAFALSVSFLPALITLLPARKRKVREEGNGFLGRYVEWLANNTKKISLSLVALTLFVVWALPKNSIDDNFYDYFGTHFETRQANDFIFENLTGIATLEYKIDSQAEMGIANPEFLSKIQSFADWYETQPEVYNVNVITDTFKRLNKNMHGESEAFYKLPSDKELASQYLLLYELSLPFGLSLDNQLTTQKSATRMVVTLRKGPSSQLLRLDNSAQQWLQDNQMAEFVSAGVSPDMMFAKIGYRNNRALLWGALIALVVISLTLIAVFKDVKIGLISLIPNLYPAAIAFALWGLAIGEVGLSLSVVGTMTLGIVVDDTVHFLNKYMHATRELGQKSAQAIRYAFETVGPAIIGTTLVLTLGFLVLAMSPFRLNSDMGLMTSITITLALILDFVILPALLLIFDKVPTPTQKAEAIGTKEATAN